MNAAVECLARPNQDVCRRAKMPKQAVGALSAPDDFSQHWILNLHLSHLIHAGASIHPGGGAETGAGAVFPSPQPSPHFATLRGARGPELIAWGEGAGAQTWRKFTFDCGVDRYDWRKAGTGHGLRQASLVLRWFSMASAPPKKRPATYADLLALPDNVVGQIVDGELVVSPRPAPLHAFATTFLGGQLSEPYGRG